MRKVWYHQILIQNNFGFLVSELIYMPDIYTVFSKVICFAFPMKKVGLHAKMPSMSFYPDFIHQDKIWIKRFFQHYPDFILIFSKFYPNFLKLTLPTFYPDKIRMKSG
jgi:hypothetical protein